MFLESARFPLDLSFRTQGGPEFNVDVQVLESAFEQRNQFWPESRIKFDVGYGIRELDKVQAMYEFFEAVGGREHGFRIRDWRAWKSVRVTSASAESDTRDPISARDQVISIDGTSADYFQLIRTFRRGPLARRKTITKPVLGTVMVATQGVEIPENRWNLDYVPDDLAVEGHETVGRVRMAANIQRTINGITQAAQAVVSLTAAHGLSIGDSIHISAVTGMTEINGRRAAIVGTTSDTLTLDLDTSGFSAYTGAGQINTQRQSLAFTVGIAGITRQAFATVTSTAPHGLVAGDIGTFSGVGGMTGINSVEAAVVEVLSPMTFRIDVNAVQFAGAGSGGSFLVSERVTAGYEYDLAARFDTDALPMSFEAWDAAGAEVPVIELRVI